MPDREREREREGDREILSVESASAMRTQSILEADARAGGQAERRRTVIFSFRDSAATSPQTCPTARPLLCDRKQMEELGNK